MKNRFMQMAIKQAKLTVDEVPVGAIVVKNGEIIACAFNKKERENDVTSHAEIIALRNASRILENWRLEDCEIYVTLEPCPMCGWAILQSRIKSIYFGSYDLKYGAFSKCYLNEISDTNINIYGGIEEEKCDKLLKAFFAQIRNNG